METLSTVAIGLAIALFDILDTISC